MAPPSRRAAAGGVSSVAVASLLVLAAAAVGAYVLAELNQRRFRLQVVDGNMVVERGRHLPLGFVPYLPEAEELRRAYAPWPTGPHRGPAAPEIFEERSDLDRALFATVATWIRGDVATASAETLDRAHALLLRLELLPGLSEGQRDELRRLRADLAYDNARRLLLEALATARSALADLERASSLETRRAAEAGRWLEQLRPRLEALDELSRGPRAASQAAEPEVPAPTSGQPPAEEPL